MTVAMDIHAQGTSQNTFKLMSEVANGPATWVFIGDSITAGTGSTGATSGWAYQVVSQIQKVGNYYAGSGFCSTENIGLCTSSSTGTWVPLQGAGPSQTVATTFSETKTGSSGATWTTGAYEAGAIDVVYYTNAQTTSTACSISIDHGSPVVVGGATASLTPKIYTAPNLSNFSLHSVTVTSDGTCNLYGMNFRVSSGLQMWSTARSGATTAAFGTPNQLSWLSVVPNLAGIFVELGQNDSGSLTQPQSLANLQAIVSYVQSLPTPVPVIFVYAEAPKYDTGQGALYSATQSTIAQPNGYDSISIYSSWGANSYATLPAFYVGGADMIHPSQAGHNDMATIVLSVLGVPPSIDANPNTIIPAGAFLGAKDSFGNTLSIASISNGNVLNLGGGYVGNVCIGTGGASGTCSFQVLNNGHIGITPQSAAPTASSCGTQPTVNGNDVKGQVTEGTGAAGCTIRFGNSYGGAPSCVVSMQTGAITYSLSATAITVVNATGVPSGNINYVCF